MWGYVRLGVLSRLLRPLIKYTTYNTLQNVVCWWRGRELNPLQQGYEPRPVTELSPQLPLVYVIPRAVYLFFPNELAWSLTRREASIKVSFLFWHVARWHSLRAVRKKLL